MKKTQNLQSMASLCKGIPGLLKNDTNFSPSPRKLHTHGTRINVAKNNNNNIGFSLKGCADFRDNKKGPNFEKDVNVNVNVNGNVNGGVYKTRVFTLSQQPFSEVEFQVKEGKKDGGVLDANGGGCENRGFSDGSSSLPEKIVVAVDVDEVLGNFVSALNKYIADRYSSIHSVSEYHVYEFYKIWKCSRDEADFRVHEFFKTPYFKNGIFPLPGAQETLNKLSNFCNLSVVTSRQHVIKDHTIEWLEKHYPGLFEEIHFGNHWALDGESKPKSEMCRSMGAKVLIDDNPRYALECAEVGIRVLLFDYKNSYPWCKTGSSHQHPLVTKVHNWEEVEQQLMCWMFSSHL